MSEPLDNHPQSQADIFTASDGRLRATWRVILAIVAFVLIAYGAAVLSLAFQPSSDNRFNAIYRPLMAVLLSATYVAMWRGLDRRDRFFHNVGLGFSRRWVREMLVGCGLGAALIGVCVLLIAVIGDYSSVPSTEASKRVAFLVLVHVWVLFWGAIAEEMAFRGYPFQRMMEAWGSVPAICLSSLLFGSVHLLNPHFAVMPMVNTMLIGALFAVVYRKTRSLWLPWGLHFGWNFALGVVFGLPVSGLYIFAVWRRGIAAGPDWLTGGSYGIEASWTAAVIVLLSTFAAWKWWPESPRIEADSPPPAGIQ